MKSSPSGTLHSSHKSDDNSILITKIYFNTYTILKISNSHSPQNFEIFFHRAERPKTMYNVCDSTRFHVYLPVIPALSWPLEPAT